MSFTFGETWPADGKNENPFTPFGMRINFFTTVALYIQLFLDVNYSFAYKIT